MTARLAEPRRHIQVTAGADGAILALDEVQKVTRWSDTVKQLWDEDTVTGLPLRVVPTGA